MLSLSVSITSLLIVPASAGTFTIAGFDDVIPGFVFKTKLFTPESLISSSISLPMPLVSLSMPESAILSTSSLSHVTSSGVVTTMLPHSNSGTSLTTLSFIPSQLNVFADNSFILISILLSISASLTYAALHFKADKIIHFNCIFKRKFF